MKELIKNILRKVGLLKAFRRLVFRRKYRHLISKFKGQKHFDVAFRGLRSRFSLEDPFSAAFFAEYFNSGIYEQDGLETMLSNTSENSILFDIGANIGYFTCLGAVHCRGGEVHAFEMGRENFLILQKNIALNGLTNVRPVCKAVADAPGSVSIVNSPVGNAVARILEDSAPGGDIISVPSVSLDEYCAGLGITPDFIKIDVEGAEMKVLAGMKTLMSKRLKLLVEIHDKELRIFHSSKQEVLDFLTSAGFQLEIIGNKVKKNPLVFAWRDN